MWERFRTSRGWVQFSASFYSLYSLSLSFACKLLPEESQAVPWLLLSKLRVQTLSPAWTSLNLCSGTCTELTISQMLRFAFPRLLASEMTLSFGARTWRQPFSQSPILSPIFHHTSSIDETGLFRSLLSVISAGGHSSFPYSGTIMIFPKEQITKFIHLPT